MRGYLSAMKSLRLLAFPILLALLPELAAAQSKFDGIWEGILMQKNEYGITNEFKIEMRLYKQGKKISGHTTVHWGDKWAKKEIKGTMDKSGNVELAEVAFIEKSEIPGYFWCLNTMRLTVKEKEGDIQTLVMEGSWGGKSEKGDCPPGTVLLEKQTPRA